ncbi:MAG TPA: RNA polymerase sigma-54 factor, partial [Sphingobacterium sp.]|nr:RNA polymerase sigma-54 factor [Sphingobacterium sp.]
MLKQTLQQKLLQKLSPQQIQFIKLLQVPTVSLDARIKEELEENPALEDGSLANMAEPND